MTALPNKHCETKHCEATEKEEDQTTRGKDLEKEMLPARFNYS